MRHRLADGTYRTSLRASTVVATAWNVACMGAQSARACASLSIWTPARAVFHVLQLLNYSGCTSINLVHSAFRHNSSNSVVAFKPALPVPRFRQFERISINGRVKVWTSPAHDLVEMAYPS